MNKLIRKYVWNDKHSPPVQFDTLLLPIEQGGLGMLDLVSRNEAIDIMWLKTYLQVGPDRPWWTFVADNLFAKCVAQNCVPSENCLRINPFLQNWKPTKTHLLDDLRHISAIAKKYGLRLEVLAPERSIIREMPMWDHAQADRAKIRTLGGRSAATACLKNTHSLITVGDFEKFVLGASEPEHDKHSRACQCDRCTYLRLELGCSAPADCYA